MITSERYKNTLAISAPSWQDWRSWLEEHHSSASAVWLIIYHKSSRIPSVYYDEAVEQALCFGWIDSVPNKRDETSYYLYFAQRKPKSLWSKINKDRVEKLIKLGQMHRAGLELVTRAKEMGTWNALDTVDALHIPNEMAQLFQKNPLAKQHFEAFPPSIRRGILEWILQAKSDETRLNRIMTTVTLAEQNIRANQYTKKK